MVASKQPRCSLPSPLPLSPSSWGIGALKLSNEFLKQQGPVVQRPDNFIQWISRYPSVSICAKISVFPLEQANMHTLATVKFGSVQKPWTTFYVKYILDPE